MRSCQLIFGLSAHSKIECFIIFSLFLFAEVNAVSAHVRTRKMCETRLRTYTSNVKNKKTKEHNRLKKTGGGELVLDNLTPVAAQMHRLALVYLGVDRLEGSRRTESSQSCKP